LTGALTSLGVTSPVMAAPMAGGPTTPRLVTAAAEAGCLGFLAGGYKSADALGAQLDEVRAATDVFGVNLFAPNRLPVDPDAYRRYAAAVQEVAAGYGLTVDDVPREDDDAWSDKIDLLLAAAVPVVSFTFGVPEPAVVDALRRVGSLTVQTITSPREVDEAVTAGVDVLAVQAAAAGGHRGTLHPERPSDEAELPELVAATRARTDLPVLAAGGISTPADVRAALQAGAAGVLVGTVLLRSEESGASAVHQAAIAEQRRVTVVTRAFSGRPARGLRNDFIDRFDDIAPLGYPALHHLTSGLRRAAAAAGDPELVNLWAGTGYRNATAEPAGLILQRLSGLA
jgi:NAD(P)H-dependent flavin oxidoreductase YrpB (nitropropane dioxygenase family)